MGSKKEGEKEKEMGNNIARTHFLMNISLKF